MNNIGVVSEIHETRQPPSESISQEPSPTGKEHPTQIEQSSPSSEQPSSDSSEQPNTGAFDPETGEINWDCPCLGGMAHGPCGQEFRDAFSCFVFSEADPKGIDCVERFRVMQDCFRAHPEVYAEGEHFFCRHRLEEAARY